MLQLLSRQLQKNSNHPLSQKTTKSLLEWVENYLMKPHTELGRKGAVCPFMEKSYLGGQIFFDTHTSMSEGFEKDIKKISEKIKVLQKYYLDELKKSNSTDNVIMLIFPNWECNYCDSIFNQVLTLLKDDFVSKKLMLGEFHSEPPKKSGLRNPSFKPLYSPIPMLVIREMVSSDIAFLKANSKWVELYNNHFKN